jgi:hypothetical protein
MLAGWLAREMFHLLYKLAKASIGQSRPMKYQSLNEYRKHFSLKPYASFE